MSSVVKMLIKGLGIFLLLLLLFSAGLYYRSIQYPQYDLQALSSLNMNTQEDWDVYVDSLVGQMSVREKIDQMYGERFLKVAPKLGFNWFLKDRFPHVYVGRNKRLNIPPWVLSDGPRGARVMDLGVEGVTTFPVAMSRGASWDIDLEYQINEAIASEMRANKTNYAATPCINLLRHPAWGRAQETYGEDPFLLGQMGKAAVLGIQKHGVMACPKHFAVNSLENSRWVVDVQLEERTLREVYLPHFKKTIQEAKPASLMSAYNSVLGEFCGSNSYLLNDILREEWDFEGFVSSDWLYGTYDGVKSVKAGLDVEMPWQNYYDYNTLEDALKKGELKEEDLDKIVKRILRTRLPYAALEDQEKYPHSIIANENHTLLARQAAEKGMVLIKNDQSTLPFSTEGSQKILLVGPLAKEANTGDRGSSNSRAQYVVTPYDGLLSLHEELGNELIYHDGKDHASLEKIAKEVDHVIYVVGYNYLDEGEYMTSDREAMQASAQAKGLVGEKGLGGDRLDLGLRPRDSDLLENCLVFNPKSVVVYIGGSALDMNSWIDKASSVLFAWYPGMEGGNAIANIIYGRANPSGKLPFSIAQKAEDYPPFNPYTDTLSYGYYHGYSLFDKNQSAVAFPFGFGLSYTTFEYSNLTLQDSDSKEEISVKVQIENTGSVDGEEVVQLYVNYSNSSIDRPVKLLRAFDKVFIKAGETVEVDLRFPIQDLAWYNPDAKQWEIEAMEYGLGVGGSSVEEEMLTLNFIVK